MTENTLANTLANTLEDVGELDKVGVWHTSQLQRRDIKQNAKP